MVPTCVFMIRFTGCRVNLLSCVLFVSIPFTSGHFLELEPGDQLLLTNFDVSIPFTSGHFLELFFLDQEGDSGCVSIPFTSGHFLERTWTLGNLALGIMLFQSPSHRGTFSNVCDNRPSPEVTTFQSPSHRGTFSNGTKNQLGYAVQTKVSIPFTSGHFLESSKT